MRTKTTSKAMVPVSAQIDLFAAFQLRIQSLDHYKEQVRAARERGERLLQELAEMPRTGDVLRDGRKEADLEERLEGAFDDYNAALNRLGWELKE